jgi:hypothetical protein
MSERSEIEVFQELEGLCKQPGIIDVVAFLCFKDTFIHANEGKIDAEVMAQQYDRSKLSRTELSTLVGLVCKHGCIEKALNIKELGMYASQIYSLFEELHSTFYNASDFKELLENKVLPNKILSSGIFMREAIFYAGEGVYKHQYRDLSQIRYQADNTWLKNNKGFLIEHATEVITAIEQFQLDNINSHVSAAKSLYLASYLPIFKFTAQALTNYSILPIGIITAVISALSAIPSEGMSEFNSVDDFNHRNAFPIIQLDNNVFITLQSYSLWEALYESPFFWFNQDKSYLTTASKHRGEFTEDFTAQRLVEVFGEENVYTNIDIFEGKNKTGEIDVLVTFGHVAFVIQAKSKKLTIPARKGNSNQLKSDFKKAVQDAYNQAFSCAELLQKQGVTFKHSNGDILKLEQNYKTIFPFCVISDYYPALASQARQFLDFEITEQIQFPCVMDISLIDLLAEMLETPLLFIDYIQKRCDFADSLISHHELTILATYLKQNLYFEDDFNMIMLEDDISAELELAMLARRDGFDAPKTPEGMLTAHADTYVGGILSDIEHSPDYCMLQLGCHLLSLSGDTKEQYNENIEKLINLYQKDGNHHDITFGFTENKSGLTIHCNDESISTAYKKLATHSEKRKYTCKADTWIGLCFCPIKKEIKFATYHEALWEQSDELDEIVKDLPRIGKQHSINYENEKSAGQISPREKPPIVNQAVKVGRNTQCPCGSGNKYKRCCY